MNNRTLFNRYRKNAMKSDFSWERTVGEYLKVYESAKTVKSGVEAAAAPLAIQS